MDDKKRSKWKSDRVAMVTLMRPGLLDSSAYSW